MSTSKRAPNELESKLHQAALATPNNELTAKQAESIIPDAKSRQKALNFLLAVGLFKTLQNAKGQISFRAVTKGEINATKDLTGEENLVLGHIKTSENEGIWTKHLKAKTNLHQTVIDRCLKTLVQKKLIKRVPSVQHPTQKIYMLEGLEPSITLTGGPWYTDNELDTEFIETLMKACFKFIRDLSFPKHRDQQAEGALYPISKSPKYPTAQQVRNALRQARLTETDLSVEHVEMLLNVLVLDGEIEKLPAFGTSLWDSSALDDDGFADERTKKKKRKHRSSDTEEDQSSSKRRKKRKHTAEDSDSDRPVNKKSKRKRTHNSDDSDDASSKSSKRRSRKDVDDSDQSDQELSDEDGSTRRRTNKKKKKTKRSRDSSSDESSDSDTDSDRGHRSKSKLMKRSPSPQQPFSFDEYDEAGGNVYRAIRQERLNLGWTQAPCSICPSFEFCKDGGPVNPRECVYYGDWLLGSTVSAIEDIV